LDFGVYFQITNQLPVPLYFWKFVSAEAGCCTYSGPSSVPNDGQPHQVQLNDPCAGRGAEGTAYFIAEVDGVVRQYAWYGNCPVWSSSNGASGPGVSAFNTSGHPLTVAVSVDTDTPGWVPAGQLVEHVFVLMLENRAFDHMLGFSGITGTDAATGKPTSVIGLSGSESNSYNGQAYPVVETADWVMPVDPGHDFLDVVEQLAGAEATYPPSHTYPAVNNSGFVANYVKDGGGAAPGEIMKCYAPAQLPVLNALATDFAVLDGWRASMPGPTWPNRYFMMAGSAGGLDHTPSTLETVSWETHIPAGFSFEHGTLFEALSGAGKPWVVYRGDVGALSGSIPIAASLKGVTVFDLSNYSNFADDVNGDYPYTFTLIEPNYGDAASESYLGGTSQHPIDDVRQGEALIKSTYEALRNSPLWPSSVLIVTWDEHGGFYDHDGPVPGDAPEPGDDITTWGHVNIYGFDFDTYGVRVPAVVVSPYTPANLIDHRAYDHASIPATVERLSGLAALTARDAAALDVRSLLSLSTPRDAPTELPNPAGVPAPAPAVAPALKDDTEPIGASNLAGFVGAALHIHLQMAPPEERPTILAAVGTITTKGDARRYVEDVATKLNHTMGTRSSPH
jgi:phospholipase C